MLEIVASLIDAARGVIYDRHMLIVQATGLFDGTGRDWMVLRFFLKTLSCSKKQGKNGRKIPLAYAAFKTGPGKSTALLSAMAFPLSAFRLALLSAPMLH